MREVECVVGAFQIGVILCIKLQKQNMVSNMNEIIKRRWDEGVFLRKRLNAQGKCTEQDRRWGKWQTT